MSTVTNLFRSSRPEVFCKKGVLKNFAKFTEKLLCKGLYFNKVAGFRPDKKAQTFSCAEDNYFFRNKFVRFSFLEVPASSVS